MSTHTPGQTAWGTAKAYRVCPLCEATCGLELTISGGAVSGVRGDRDDVFSKGFICPKGAAFGQLDNDPDRLRRPMVRGGDRWREVSWDDAFAAVARGLGGVVSTHGRQAVGIYLGNPNIHTLAGGLYGAGLARALGSPNLFSASTVDQMPKHVSCGLMFGDPLAIPVPDLDRTDFLLLLGANPLESNGSLATAADWPGKLKALKARGGRLVVVDPRSTRTAAMADTHLPIRPGTDPYLLAALALEILGSGVVEGGSLGELAGHVSGLDELPAAVMAQEMTTPGDGQIHAMITVAGNPVLSTPDGAALDAAMADLEFMVSVDPYLNETTRRAHVILPPPPSRSAHYDIAFSELAIRNTGRFNPASLPMEEGDLDESTILARLTLIAQGQPEAPARLLDDTVIADTLAKSVQDPESPVYHRDPAELRGMLTGSGSTEQRLDLLLRLGAYGDGFGAQPQGLCLQRLVEAPHGIDLGPLQSRIPEILRTPSGQIELAPQEIRQDLDRLRTGIEALRDGLVLIGRRHLRSSNSWMHNLSVLNSGSNTCTLQVHPNTASEMGLTDGADACVTSRSGEVTVTVEVTGGIRPGVVSLPHGWGHSMPGTRGADAGARPGVNSNLLTDPLALDPLSGTSVLNGIPVTVKPAPG